ncbi:hypothetical protein B0H14DRAFT_3426197 [Mycena olivaceomarginata]|nr:hypothetical protein B0H14DRAFT_3426197 [Mycena olivaceomarginata]
MSTARKRPEKMSRTFSRPRHFPHPLPAISACLLTHTNTLLSRSEDIDNTSVYIEPKRRDKVLLLEAGGALLCEGTSELLGFLWSPTVQAQARWPPQREQMQERPVWVERQE